MDIIFSCFTQLQLLAALYFLIAIGISFFFGAYYASKCELVHPRNWQWNEFSWNSCLYFLGFCIFYGEYFLFRRILTIMAPGALGILVFLFIVLLFWGTFCLSGRGVGLAQASLERGIEINITWKGLQFKLPPLLENKVETSEKKA